jgi:tetratricopeptide (TPR) repeat protein
VKQLALCLVLIAGVASAAPKSGSPAQKKADVLFEQGQASYQSGKYQDAITQFKQAFELVHDPVYLFNIAQSYRKVADCTSADEFYRRYLEAAPKAENKDKVEQWLEELRPCVEQRKQDQEAARKSQEEAERLRRERELADKQRPAPTPVETTVDRGAPLRLGGIALAGLGAVGLGIGIGYGIKGSSIRGDIDEACARGCQWDSPEIQQQHEAGKSANTRALIGSIGGGVAVIGGVALYMLGRRRVETVMVTPTSGGATVSAKLSF